MHDGRARGGFADRLGRVRSALEVRREDVRDADVATEGEMGPEAAGLQDAMGRESRIAEACAGGFVRCRLVG